jgi:hypothetical protein
MSLILMSLSNSHNLIMSDLNKRDNDLPVTTKEKVETILILAGIGVGGILAIVFVGKLIGLVVPILILGGVGYFAYPYIKAKLNQL